MNTNTIIMIVIVALVLLSVGGVLGVIFSRRQRTKRLKEKFGPEYERTVREVGDREEAEDRLESRIEEVESLDIHSVENEKQREFVQKWQSTQATFVDHPIVAIKKADLLIRDVMYAKGYPVEDFEDRASKISVDYPELVIKYRNMREIVTRSDFGDISTEEMRQSMVHSKALFEELLGLDTDAVKDNGKAQNHELEPQEHDKHEEQKEKA